MKTSFSLPATATPVRFAAAVVLAMTVAACAHHGHRGTQHHEAQQALSAANEVPPNTSNATGIGTIHIGPDGAVTGSITVAGMAPTAAHIHEAPVGKNGPVIVPFAKIGENAFAPAPGARLTDAQYQSYLAGNLYVNVHSATYPGGEIRAQLVPRQ
jgi:CHRD domain